MKTLENWLNRHLAWFTTNGMKMHRIEQYKRKPHWLKYNPKRVKDYQTRNEQVRHIHKTIATCETFDQLRAAERLAELFAQHHGEKFSPSCGRLLEQRYNELSC